MPIRLQSTSSRGPYAAVVNAAYRRPSKSWIPAFAGMTVGWDAHHRTWRDRVGLRSATLMLLFASLASSPAVAGQTAAAKLASGERRSYVQAEADLAVTEPGPHAGTGSTTAFPFFADEPGFDLVFRKRALHPGSSIGLH